MKCWVFHTFGRHPTGSIETYDVFLSFVFFYFHCLFVVYAGVCSYRSRPLGGTISLCETPELLRELGTVTGASVHKWVSCKQVKSLLWVSYSFKNGKSNKGIQSRTGQINRINVSLCYIEETKRVLCDGGVSESDKERAPHCREDMEGVGWSDSDRKWCVQWPPAPYWLNVSRFWPMTDPAFWEGLLILLASLTLMLLSTAEHSLVDAPGHRVL